MKFIIFLLIPLILSIGLAPVLPFVNGQLNENSQCTADQVLVKRYSDESFHCLDSFTATIWDTYGSGKIVNTSTEQSEEATTQSELSSFAQTLTNNQPNIIIIISIIRRVLLECHKSSPSNTKNPVNLLFFEIRTSFGNNRESAFCAESSVTLL